MGTWVNEGGGMVGGAEKRRGLAAFIHAEQQLQAQSNPRVPPEGKDADVARHNWRPQEVLHRRRAVRVPVKHLRSESTAAQSDVAADRS